MSYSLDPNRDTSFVVIDNFDEAGREGVYAGSHKDCEEFIAAQEDGDIIGMYKIVPNFRP